MREVKQERLIAAHHHIRVIAHKAQRIAQRTKKNDTT
jgi:hypothetical protein